MPAAENVVALTSGWFGVNGESVLVLEGSLFRATDPVVKKYPSHFGPQRATEPVRIDQAAVALGARRGA